MLTGGRNQGRVGTIVHKERHLGGYDIVHVRDILDREFATRLSNVFIIGHGSKASISLPKGGGCDTISAGRSYRILLAHKQHKRTQHVALTLEETYRGSLCIGGFRPRTIRLRSPC